MKRNQNLQGTTISPSMAPEFWNTVGIDGPRHSLKNSPVPSKEETAESAKVVVEMLLINSKKESQKICRKRPKKCIFIFTFTFYVFGAFKK